MSDRGGPGGPTGSPKSATERKRRERDRKKDGIAGVFQVEVPQTSIKRMIKRGWFNDVEARNRRIVTTALENLIDCYGRGTLDPEPKAPLVATGTRT